MSSSSMGILSDNQMNGLDSTSPGKEALEGKRNPRQKAESFAIPRPAKRCRRYSEVPNNGADGSIAAMNNTLSDDSSISLREPEFTSTPLVTPTKPEEVAAAVVSPIRLSHQFLETEHSPPRRRKGNGKVENVDDLNVIVRYMTPSCPSEQGIVYVVGEGKSGQLGLGQHVTSTCQPLHVRIPDYVVSVAAGAEHTLCLTNKGEVYSFGSNEYYSLGRETECESESFLPKKVNLDVRIVQIVAGERFSAALSTCGDVYIWGAFLDSRGVMGLIPFSPDYAPERIMHSITIVQMAAGQNHLACLSCDGKVYTFGCGENGQLGRVPGNVCRLLVRLGSPEATRTEDDIPLRLNGYISPMCLTWGPMIAPHHSGTLPPFDKVWAAPNATFARAIDTGNIYACGQNYCMELGFKDDKIRYFPEPSDAFRGWKWLWISSNHFQTLAVDKNSHVCILGKHKREVKGQIYSPGESRNVLVPTQILPLQNEKCTFVHCGSSTSYAITDKGKLYSWGNDKLGRLLRGRSSSNEVMPATSQVLKGKVVIQIDSGNCHTVLLVRPQFQVFKK